MDVWLCEKVVVGKEVETVIIKYFFKNFGYKKENNIGLWLEVDVRVRKNFVVSLERFEFVYRLRGRINWLGVVEDFGKRKIFEEIVFLG